MRRRLANRRGWIRAAVAAAIACSPLVPTGPPAGAATALTVVASPNQPGPAEATLSGVACASPTLCFGVGIGHTDATFIEEWNGTTWTAVPSPDPAGASEATLAGAACAGPTSCFAVGWYTPSGAIAEQTLVEAWNGTSWSIVPSPNKPPQYDSALLSVACASATACFAVGTDLIERWDGSAWSLAAGPNPVGMADNELDAVSCAGTTSCFAVGTLGFSSTHNGPPATLTERWDGSAWSIVASPNPTAKFGFGDALSGVSCPAANSCFAAGHAGADLLVERWNGARWSVAAVPEAALGGGTLHAVSCGSATSCFAVGSTETVHGTEPTLIERWNGTAWTPVASPSPSGRASLLGVSCASAGSCVAVGTFDLIAIGATEAFAEHWNGTAWSIAPSPSDSSQSSLSGVSCTSGSNCFAVGGYITASGSKALVEHWNGATWSLVATPGVTGERSVSLSSVSCSSPTFCFAVGSAETGDALRPVTERWNGSRWTVVASPVVDALSGVSCVSPKLCFAAGFKVTDLGAELLIERWNGTKWSISLLENPTGFNNYLTGVSCSSATNCAAVGFVGSDLSDQGLEMHWNGTVWSVVFGFAKSVSTPPVDMTGVSCVSTTFCVAVGSRTVRWNGRAWVKIAPAGGGAVSCVSPTSCLAVGGAGASQWNGTTWTAVSGPSPTGSLAGVSCVSVTTCFAVGRVGVAGGTETLVEQSS